LTVLGENGHIFPNNGIATVCMQPSNSHGVTQNLLRKVDTCFSTKAFVILLLQNNLGFCRKEGNVDNIQP
jgi:hypothetical protein